MSITCSDGQVFSTVFRAGPFRVRMPGKTQPVWISPQLSDEAILEMRLTRGWLIENQHLTYDEMQTAYIEFTKRL